MLLERWPDHPQRAEALYALGVAEQEDGQFEPAAATLETFAASFPAHESAADARRRRDVSLLALAQVQLRQGDAAAAEASLDRCLTRQANHELTLDARVLRATARHQRGDFAGGIADADAILNANPPQPMRSMRLCPRPVPTRIPQAGGRRRVVRTHSEGRSAISLSGPGIVRPCVDVPGVARCRAGDCHVCETCRVISPQSVGGGELVSNRRSTLRGRRICRRGGEISGGDGTRDRANGARASGPQVGLVPIRAAGFRRGRAGVRRAIVCASSRYIDCRRAIDAGRVPVPAAKVSRGSTRFWRPSIGRRPPPAFDNRRCCTRLNRQRRVGEWHAVSISRTARLPNSRRLVGRTRPAASAARPCSISVDWMTPCRNSLPCPSTASRSGARALFMIGKIQAARANLRKQSARSSKSLTATATRTAGAISPVAGGVAVRSGPLPGTDQPDRIGPQTLRRIVSSPPRHAQAPQARIALQQILRR